MRSGVGAAWAWPLDFFLDFDETCFFFLAVELEFEEEACGAPGPAAAGADTTRAALARSAAPKRNSEARFSMGQTKCIAAIYCSGAGTAPARYTVSNCSPPDRRRTLNRTFCPGFRPVTARR